MAVRPFLNYHGDKSLNIISTRGEEEEIYYNTEIITFNSIIISDRMTLLQVVFAG